MSILLIDIGNTRLKWALVENQNLNSELQFSDHGYISHQSPSNLIELCSQKSWQIDQIICSSVISIEQTQLIKTTFKEAYPTASWHLINGLALIEKISTDYLDPVQLGSDRRAMVIAAQHLFPEKNILIVGAGTATTIDILTSSARHLGGWILPGFSLMQDSLTQGTQGLRIEGLAIANQLTLGIGVDTRSAIEFGILSSQLGAIEVAKQFAKTNGVALDLIVLSGGNAHHLLNHQSRDIKAHHEDNLVLKGLLAWHQKS